MGENIRETPEEQVIEYVHNLDGFLLSLILNTALFLYNLDHYERVSDNWLSYRGHAFGPYTFLANRISMYTL